MYLLKPGRVKFLEKSPAIKRHTFFFLSILGQQKEGWSGQRSLLQDYIFILQLSHSIQGTASYFSSSVSASSTDTAPVEFTYNSVPHSALNSALCFHSSLDNLSVGVPPDFSVNPISRWAAQSQGHLNQRTHFTDVILLSPLRRETKGFSLFLLTCFTHPPNCHQEWTGTG